MLSPATPLRPREVAQIHAASLEILDGTGLDVHHEGARTVFSRHGCRADGTSRRITIPPAVVERYRASISPTFTFIARDPRFDRTIPRDGPVVVTGSSAPDLVDPDTGKLRRATSGDIGRIARLVQALPGHDVLSIPVIANDAPPGLFTPSRLLPALTYCTKPLRCTTRDEEDLAITLRFLSAAAGSEGAYMERPFVTMHYCPVVSPLTLDRYSTGALMSCCERALPVFPSIVPNAGLTAPMSLAGTLAQGNAEFLAAAVLMQMVREGTPMVYSTLPTVADLRSGAYASGGIESGILHMGFARLARFYGVPYGGYVGMTNANTADAQAGYETAMSAAAAVLAGASMLNLTGLLDALRTFDYAKLVIDDEIALMLKQLARGFPGNDLEAALEAIRRVGPGGTFVVDDHTVERMRSATLLTTMSDRDSRTGWEARGAPDTRTRALACVRELLARDAEHLLDHDASARISGIFPGLMVPDPGGRMAPDDGGHHLKNR